MPSSSGIARFSLQSRRNASRRSTHWPASSRGRMRLSRRTVFATDLPSIGLTRAARAIGPALLCDRAAMGIGTMDDNARGIRAASHCHDRCRPMVRRRELHLNLAERRQPRWIRLVRYLSLPIAISGATRGFVTGHGDPCRAVFSFIVPVHRISPRVCRARKPAAGRFKAAVAPRCGRVRRSRQSGSASRARAESPACPQTRSARSGSPGP